MARLSSNIVAFRIAIAAQEGADIDGILSASGAPPGLMRGEPPYVDLQTERNVWDAIVEATGRDDIGLVCGQRFPTQANGMLGYVMANAPTIRVAVEKCCTYQRVLGDSMGMVCERGPDTTRISIEQWSPWHDTLRYTVDTFMAAILSWTNANAPAPVCPLRVGFRYERPGDVSSYESIFAPAPVTFGADDSYQIYENSTLDQPVIGASQGVFAVFEDKVQRLLGDLELGDTWAFRVRQRILDALKGEAPSVERIASELAVSVRKLQQRLSDECTSYSNLLTDARRDLAEEYLKAGEVGNDEIAYLLGYSEVSVFSRSFKKWTGQTPSEFRAANT
ncbi:AraC family transcriptional regulator [Aliiroseovarius sp. S1339]|uniref:AraC family transcriptional regulator n=1 Tax=Aliiroseovarius sp. S1339 TaxID=2936990 RepID=UPI0020C02DDF|nr:AraC family transcriptional regulator [Aliiroseovarius sp. S1339]MCK8464172.1 AraC family transcriptional regulator [Aliiroseovarius sp. S1339]